MAIVAGDIKICLSTKSGSAGNSETSTPAASLGKYISTTEVSGTALNNIFDDVTGTENAASESEYRCIFFRNAHATLTAHSVVAYLYSQVSSGATANLGVDTTAASAIGASSAQALEVADEDTAPSGVSFSAAATIGAAVSLGDIAAGYCRALWIKRTTANTAAVANDGCVVRWSFGTEA